MSTQTHPQPGPVGSAQSMSKSAKRRAKQRARQTATNGHSLPPNVQQDDDIPEQDEAPELPQTPTRDATSDYDPDAGANDAHSSKKAKKKKKKKKSKNGVTGGDGDGDSNVVEPLPRASGMSRDKIWITSNQEERERIKEFWLGLGEEERKSLVKVEKDAVLRKMKEQQKHTCSCSVCGRKRTAIEEELEGLYDAYYNELEHYANRDPQPLLPNPRDLDQQPRRILLPLNHNHESPSIPQGQGPVPDDAVEEQDGPYSDGDLDDEGYSDEEDAINPSQMPPDPETADFLAFGNSLQVQGGILTVADDLLKNDGRRFIEMMEQLAERRMAREEDRDLYSSRHYAPQTNGSNVAYGPPPPPHSHGPPPPPPDEEEFDDDEEEDEDYEGDQDDDDEEYEEEEDAMTENQRMEEGRRMFQIFAARMFEQRVLTAYKIRVAKERQDKLLEELEEEDLQVVRQKAKKAKIAQKRKDKLAEKKQVLLDQVARKEKERLAEQARLKEEEEQKAEEARQRAEAKKKEREEQKKALEADRRKKEVEKRKKGEQQEKEHQQRLARERERRERDEQRAKEEEAKREEHKKRERETQLKAENEAKERDAREARDRGKSRKEDRAPQKTAAAPQPAADQAKKPPQAPVPIILPQHQPSQPATSFSNSPKIPVATPVLPKAPTPLRPRTASQQVPVPPAIPNLTTINTTTTTAIPAPSLQQQGAGASQEPSPHPITPVQSSPGHMVFPFRKSSGGPAQATASQTASPIGVPTSLPGPVPSQLGMHAMYPTSHTPPHLPPGLPPPRPLDMGFPLGYRGPPPGVLPMPPGIAPSPMGPRGFMQPPSGFGLAPGDSFGPVNPPTGPPNDMSPQSHSRHASSTFESPPNAGGHPIGKPTPIRRPGSVVMGVSPRRDTDDVLPGPNLGSSALLEDSEDPLIGEAIASHLRQPPPGLIQPFIPGPYLDGFGMSANPWPSAPAFTAPPGFGPIGSLWGAPQPTSLSASLPRPSVVSRSFILRARLCLACKDLVASGVATLDGYIDMATVLAILQSGDPGVTADFLLELCETEGAPQNGGGTFDVRRDALGPGKHAIRWDSGDDMPRGSLSGGSMFVHRAVGAPGEVYSNVSPIAGSGGPRGPL